MHRAVTKDGLEVAMKIQYPGVANSIESDIENVRRLLNYTNLIPKGLFLDSAVKVLIVILSLIKQYIHRLPDSMIICKVKTNSLIIR